MKAVHPLDDAFRKINWKKLNKSGNLKDNKQLIVLKSNPSEQIIKLFNRRIKILYTS